MADFSNVVRTVYKADVSEAKAAVQSLRGEERARAKEVLDGLNEHNAKLESQLATFAKVGAAIGTVGAAAAIAQKSMAAYLEDVRLQSASAGANIDKLRDATAGLVEQDNLMAFAGKAMHGTWKLNQEQMETVLHGALALRKTMGVELQPTIDALTESIAKGNTRALKEFGIVAQDKAGVLKELSEKYKSLGGDAALAGDGVERSGVKLADAFHDMGAAIGELVAELKPFSDALAEAMSWVAKGVHFLGGGQSQNDQFKQIAGFIGDPTGPAFAKKQADFEARYAAQMAVANAALGAYAAQQDESNRFAFRRAMDIKAGFEQDSSRGYLNKPQGEFHLKGVIDLTDAPLIYDNEQFRDIAALNAYIQNKKDTDLSLDIQGVIKVSNENILQEQLKKAGEKHAGEMMFEAAWERGEKAKAAAQKDLDRQQARGKDIEDIFKVPAHVDAHAEAIKALAGTYAVLGNAAGDAYEAMVTGSMSAGAAAKKAIADGLLALGKEFAVKAIGELAAGTVALFLNPPEAAAHFAAAGLYSAGAVAAGAGAAALGAGQSSSAPSGGARGAANSNIGGGSRGGDLTRNVTVILGGSYDNMSERERNARLARAVDRGFAAAKSTTIRDG